MVVLAPEKIDVERAKYRLRAQNRKTPEAICFEGGIMDLSGLEPLTPWLQTRCSPS
jgi:hypothetical protein